MVPVDRSSAIDYVYLSWQRAIIYYYCYIFILFN